MKIYVLTDMEGVGGVVSQSQTFAGESGYEQAREWLTLEVNEAVEGAIEGGASEILALDSHGANNVRNLRWDLLCKGARYIQGTPRQDYVHLIDESYDGLFQIGAHAMAGTAGAVLEHTMSSGSWVEMRVNGQLMGEIGLTAAAAGVYDVPFVMVSGDDKACAEARGISPDVECAVVKEGMSRNAAILKPMAEVHRLIREKARLAMSKVKTAKPFKLESPVEIEIRYFRNDVYEGIREREGVRKVAPQMVIYSGKTVVEAWRRVWGG
jgi:D-amino peptidase